MAVGTGQFLPQDGRLDRGGPEGTLVLGTPSASTRVLTVPLGGKV